MSEIEYIYTEINFPERGLKLDGALDTESASKIIDIVVNAKVDKSHVPPVSSPLEPIPEGYQLVPIEPTITMMEAGNDYAGWGTLQERNETATAQGVYKAMLQAAKAYKARMG